jgi:hypothetical protein
MDKVDHIIIKPYTSFIFPPGWQIFVPRFIMLNGEFTPVAARMINADSLNEAIKTAFACKRDKLVYDNKDYKVTLDIDEQEIELEEDDYAKIVQVLLTYGP